MTTVLLTGATGLVGSRLLPRLAEAGFDCRALVRRDVDLPAERDRASAATSPTPARYARRSKASTRSSTSRRCSGPATRTPSGGPTATAPAT